MSFDVAFYGSLSVLMLCGAVWPGSEGYRWGKRGNGPPIKPQWLGRVLFSAASLFFAYCAYSGR